MRLTIAEKDKLDKFWRICGMLRRDSVLVVSGSMDGLFVLLWTAFPAGFVVIHF
jgi:hypothetical protein